MVWMEVILYMNLNAEKARKKRQKGISSVLRMFHDTLLHQFDSDQVEAACVRGFEQGNIRNQDRCSVGIGFVRGGGGIGVSCDGGIL